MVVEVVPYDEEWPDRFASIARVLETTLGTVPGAAVEHVGSTSVPGLAAKPVIDVDVIVDREHLPAAVTALESVGYVHRGDLGVTDREAFRAPGDQPRRNVYVCVAGTLHVRNHLAIREVLRRRPDLREQYATVKLALAADPAMDIDSYLAGKSAVLQEVLAAADLTDEERLEIWRLNDPSV